MLVIKLIGAAVSVAMAVRWKRLRLPLLLLLLLVMLAVLCRMLYNSSTPVNPPGDHGPLRPFRPYDTVCPHPETSCNEPGMIPDGGSGLLPDAVTTT